MSDNVPQLIRQALDPARSVVVEACAGSGKTWLLAARIVRLLLSGVAPGEILAITFTRKAAREIEERVVDWLRLLATGDDAQLDVFLSERGVAVDALVRRQARGLYERVLAAQPPLAVNTFHGWFLQLVDAAPLSANLAGASLVDADSRLFDELWQGFAAKLQRLPESSTTQAFLRLLDRAGLDATRRLMRRALDRRSEWLAYGGLDDDALASAGGSEGRVASGAESDSGGASEASEVSEVSGADFSAAPRATAVLAALAAELGADVPGTALLTFFSGEWAGEWAGQFQAYLGFLEASELKGDQEAAATLRRALEGAPAFGAARGDEAVGAAERCFAALCPVFLTQQHTLRSKKPSKALDARHTPAGAERFLALHAALGARILACREARLAEDILAFNTDACTVFAAFLSEVDAFKRARRQIDFADAEWTVLRLLRDEATAAFLQARLDARYKHVLLDEFQDTNPLQWQILLAWLAAYSDAARPGVFLVGDPKQSIYRFRRAEPRLFTVARDFLVSHFDALPLAQDATRRNAPTLVDVINAVFGNEPVFTPFRPQTSLAGAIPGRVEVLPLCEQPEELGDGASPAPDALLAHAAGLRLRDPLREPASEPEDARRQLEAAALAEHLLMMVGRTGAPWLIETRAADGRAGQRPLRYGDIMLLVRTRSHLAIYERALAAAAIPFEAGSRGGLLGALEVRDCIALLEFLVTPVADLALAHALRAPLFACSDGDLLAVSARSEASWWARLQALVAAGEASPRLQRAERLLSDWLPLAAHLPAHDLLDRIYHQGELVARYRLAAPEAIRARVAANLNALLQLALDLDGGRYPSLPRFIDELRELRAADDGDAPDEGEIAATGGERAAGVGRVRILTIHGAKGLEAPVVWLLDANAAPRAGDAWDVLVDWAPEAEAPTHFSFYGRREERGLAREVYFEREAEAARREELNLLYVALTRARQVFIASGSVRSGKAETPYRLLESALGRLSGGTEGESVDVGEAGGGACYGAVLPRGEAPPVAVEASDAGLPAALPAIGERRRAPEGGERFGILLHALLERRTEEGEGGLSSVSDDWWRALGFGPAEFRRALAVAERLLALPIAQRYFDPAQYRRAWNEVEIGDGQGGVLRLDRLVERDDGYYVLDYKSSASDTPRLPEYRAQVAAYCQVLAGAFPARPVRGALLFADGILLELA